MTAPQTRADWARLYQELGWRPIPLKSMNKAPESTAWQNQTFAPDQLESVFTESKNIGIVLGSPSRNLLDVDLDDDATVKLAPFFLTQTDAVFGRPGKPNSHFLYRVAEQEIIRRKTYHDVDGTLLAEIRGEGHQTMVPGSTHPSGEDLEWGVLDVPTLTSDDKLELRVGMVSAAAMLGRHWHEWDSQRHAITLHLAGGLFRSGMALENVREFFKAVCSVGNEDDWEDRDKAVQSTFDRIQAGEETTGFPKLVEVIGSQFVGRIIEWMNITSGSKTSDERFTDAGNASRFVSQHKDNVIYVPDLGKFYHWDGTRFAVDTADSVVELMVETARTIFDEAKAATDSGEMKKLSAHAVKSLNHPRVVAALKLAKPKREIVVRSNELDTDPLLLNVMNGTINLRTGGLQPHDRRDRITKRAPVPYDPNAESPVFDRFLETVTDGDKELQGLLQRMAGYCATADVSEQVFFFLYGDGQNGKSKFVEALQMILGDYTRKLPTGVLTKTKYGADSTDLQNLPGIRLAITNETAKGGILDDSLIKDLTGSDRLVGRFRYEDDFEFDPTHKIVMYGNHKPKFSGTDKGIQRRPILIPFTVQIPEHIRDKHLSERFRRELPGILSWVIQGAREWRSDGLNVPASVRNVTNDYIKEQDPAGRFLDECTVSGDRIRRDDLYEAYREWAKDNGEEMKTRRDLMKEMTRLGVPESKSNGVFYRTGIRLVPEWSARIRVKNIQVDMSAPKPRKGSHVA